MVTNYHSSGKPMDVKRLIGAHLSSSEMEKVMDNLDKLGVATARHFFYYSAFNPFPRSFEPLLDYFC
ncbi:hypothetical protein [Paenibacillus sp. JNUCC31]|uniref:hypothetical protein n=1 Tax=Paenibacillus sp. JNUCC-31 TaxID=2777983 RepID=UPI002B1F08F4|nr:hypothetical protein [Paenibacillus sp. JNUCC-31]